MDDCASLDVALSLMDQARDARSAAGGMISIQAGRHRVMYGVDL